MGVVNTILLVLFFLWSNHPTRPTLFLCPEEAFSDVGEWISRLVWARPYAPPPPFPLGLLSTHFV